MKRFLVPLSVLALAFAATGCGSSAKKSEAPAAAESCSAEGERPEPWGLPPNPMELTEDAGLKPETSEQLEYHVHSFLTICLNGKQAVVPGGIGIDTEGSSVQSGDIEGYPAYGGIGEPCDKPCISPLHTHDATGVVHTESPTPTPNQLGQLFTEWDVELDENCVGEYCKPDTAIAITVDGKSFTGDPDTIELSNGKKIVITIG